MRRILLAVLLLAVLAGGLLLLARYERYEWTTDSAQALADFEAGLEALSKLYADEAIEHLEKALVADPDFAAAQLYLIRALRPESGSSQPIGKLVERLREQDLDRLNDRERMLVRHMLAAVDRDYDEARQVVDDYLEEHPDDPYALELHCGMSGEDTEMEACLERLIDLDPNLVQAQNSLGYMAFNRGDFRDAEERFEVYGYLAPDQANPHDSLGELLMVTGRYDEAEEEFRRAVSVKHDFCASWQNLIVVELLRRDPDAAGRVVDELDAAGGCPEEARHDQRCLVEMTALAIDGRWQQGYETRQQGCHANDRFFESSVLALRAGIASGHPEVAEEVIEGVSDWFRRMRGAEDPRNEVPFVLLLVGLAESAEGDAEAAIESLRRADEGFYWGGSMGTRKLYARLEQAAALAAAGRAEEARDAMASLAAVNPTYAVAPPLPPLHPVPAPPLPPLHPVPAPPPPAAELP